MIKNYHLITLTLLLVSTFSASAEKSCSSCHQEVTHFKFLHSPLTTKDHGCKVCHIIETAGPGHPRFKKLTVELNNGSCLVCHEDYINQMKKNEFIHSAIDKKACSSCHSPHGSNYQKLLKAEPKIELCLKCHEKIRDQKVNLPHHDISKMKNGCLSCHEIHASHFSNLLTNTPTKLCLSCHETESPNIPNVNSWSHLPLRNWHSPVRRGECVKCHEVHGSIKNNLVIENYKSGTYTKNLEQDMGLCLKCHLIEKFKSPTTKIDTDFRNGDINLHQLHIFGKKQIRSCSTCHEVHASQNPALIKDNFIYSDFKLPIKFTKSLNGGNCATTCHKTFEYQREKAVKNESDL